ncbi:MAG TPA: LAGLIDADG family homing endonuclease [Candidatus Nanoarchaeia archaeon]|nr:LAGLIDADG family homing endonuclease [Candidatus Nanoarchaeia archaeon]
MLHIKKLVMHGFKSFVRKTELPFTPGINVILGPNGSGKCLVGDSIVTLADGSSKRIEDIVNSRLANAVKTEDGYLMPGDGTEILSLNLENLKIEKTKIKSFVKRTSPEKILSIKTRSGRAVKTTKYHPLFILRDNKVVEARADELKQGIRIAVPRKLNFEPKSRYFDELIDEIKEEDRIYVPYKEEYALILNSIKDNLTWKKLSDKLGISHYVIKGLLDKQSINLYYLIKILKFAELSNLEIIKLIDELISNGKKIKFNFENSPEFSRFFGYLLAEGRLAESSQIWFTNGDSEIVQDYIYLVKKLFNKVPLVREYKPNCWDVIIFSEPLKKMLGKLGMASKTFNKRISNIILKNSSNKEISELLNGLYCGDGYVSKSSIEITTKSPELARGIENCLLRLGILFSTKQQYKDIKSTGFIGKYYNIIITGVNNFKEFNKNIKLVHMIKQQRILNYLNKKSNPNIDLINVNGLVKNISKELNLNIKQLRNEFPILDSYCYNQCTPSREGLQMLCKSLFLQKTSLVSDLITISNSDIFWDEIIQINEIPGEEWVYDLCIEKNHNFIANNIFVHNSNVSDALCFVLGRLSIKSMRAAKAGNLIFLGTKELAAAKEASVEIVFDNSDKIFSIDKNEITIKRIVRKNGQSIYRIEGETKTRQEVLSLLAQAGIDPNGFNIILQGEIQNFVRMHNEERRKIIEEVSGISIYESRKEKSLRELEKTEERLKEILAILRERTSYLNNLERERQQALKYQKLQKDVERYKASIIYHDLMQKKKEKEKIDAEIEKKNSEISKVKKSMAELEATIRDYELKIDSINSTIQKSTGLEQEKLNHEIANLRAELEGLKVKLENSEKKFLENENQKIELSNNIRENELVIRELQKNSVPSGSKKQKDIESKKKELEKLEEERKKFYMIKSELKSIKERIQDKNTLFHNYKTESEFLIKEIDTFSSELFDKNTGTKRMSELKVDLQGKKQDLVLIERKEIELEKNIHTHEYEINRQNKLIENIAKMDICPLCKSKITEEHIKGIHKEISPRITSFQNEINNLIKELREIQEKRKKILQGIEFESAELSKRESDLIKISNIESKKNQIKVLNEKIHMTESEISELDKRRKYLEQSSDKNSNIEQKYETARVEVQEISLRSEENVTSEISFKQREFERSKISLKQLARDEEDLKEEIAIVKNHMKQKEELLAKKKLQDEELGKKFKKMISDRDSLQTLIRQGDSNLSLKQNLVYNLEQNSNERKIEKARISAEIENFDSEMVQFKGVEVIKATKESLLHKLHRIQDSLSGIGTVNLRSLEVYDEIKKEYDSISQKVEVISKEKEGIIKIVHEIDIKKKKTFLKTLEELNEIFSRNFSQLSTKGQVFLELENKKEPFEGGVAIIVKTGHGKYFDVTSLSGGEQTLVALSLIFAIQELNPYCFYILDEIDAALDKRNSERLANLLTKYMQRGQYIIITHNDEIISNATNLYGVSMHDGISKIISLKI